MTNPCYIVLKISVKIMTIRCFFILCSPFSIDFFVSKINNHLTYYTHTNTAGFPLAGNYRFFSW